MLPKKLKPYLVNDLVRIGIKLDGGYVISQKIIENTKTLLSFGVFDEFSFELDFKKKKANLKIFCYDHTVNNIFWVKNTIHWFFHFIRNRTNFSRIFRYFKYKRFFNGDDIKHIQKKIISSKRKEPNSLSIDQILNNTNEKIENISLKIDIESDEYRILDDLINKNFLCLVIEFHNVDLHMDKILNFINTNKNMSIIHIHGNNFGHPDENGDPIYLEITFLNESLAGPNLNDINERNYPIKDLDFPNDTKREDIILKFGNLNNR